MSPKKMIHLSIHAYKRYTRKYARNPQCAFFLDASYLYSESDHWCCKSHPSSSSSIMQKRGIRLANLHLGTQPLTLNVSSYFNQLQGLLSPFLFSKASSFFFVPKQKQSQEYTWCLQRTVLWIPCIHISIQRGIH